jgi:hypothetical protein
VLDHHPDGIEVSTCAHCAATNVKPWRSSSVPLRDPEMR